MKDFIKRTIIGIISAAFLAYVTYLWMWDTIIVQWEFLNSNTLYYAILFIVGLYLLIFFSVYPTVMKFTKATLFVWGIALIIIGHHVLISDIMTQVDSKIYIGDIVKILWSVITILARTKVLVSSKVQKKQQDSKMEIIEA